MITQNTTAIDTEQKIIQYFQNLKEIKWLRTKLTKLEARKNQIENDIKNNNFYLSPDDNMSVDYSLESVSSSPVCLSPIEKKIDAAFKKLEKELENVCTEILEIKMTIRELEQKTEKINFILELLTEEKQKLIKFRYEEKQNYTYISNKLHMSKSTINKNKENVLCEISQYIKNFN